MNTAGMCWNYGRWRMGEAKMCGRVLNGSLSVMVYPKPFAAIMGHPLPACRPFHGLSRLSAWWLALGIDLERGRVGCPQDNAAHERLHRDVSLELEGLGEESQQGLDLWRQEINYQRPHEALQMRFPGEVYQNSSRTFEGTPEELIYPGMARRQVDQHGQISWQYQKLFLSRGLAGWSVGLKDGGCAFIEI